MNRNKEKFISVDTSLAQADDNTENLTTIDNHLSTPAVTSKQASTMSPRSTEPLPPHRRTPAQDQDSDHQTFDHTQVAPMNPSRLEVDQMHLNDVADPIDSETSSVQQIITERKPSCWSIASRDEAPPAPPTEWNSTAANIDRPAKRTLPIYRMPKQKHITEREKASKSFSRQQAKLKPQAPASTSMAPKPYEMNESPKDEIQAADPVASWEDGPATDSLHRLKQLQHHAQLDVEQASKVKMIQEEVLARSVQASSGNQKEGNPTQDIAQARRLDVKGTNIDPSVASSQENLNQVSNPQEKEGNPAPPHLRIQSYHHEADNKDKPLLPHLRSLTSPIVTTASKATADDEDVEPGKRILSKTPDIKVPPHRQGLSATKNRAAHGSRSGSISSPISQMKDQGNTRTIDMDEEIAATQPILDIDEEIVAALNAETSAAISVAQPTGSNSKEFNEQVIYVPPPGRASSSKVKASAAQSTSKNTDKNAKAQADQHGDDNHSTKTRSKETGHHAGVLQDVSGKRKNANLTSVSKKGAPSGAESSVKKGKKPAREFESVEYTSDLVDWDGKMNPPPVGDEWNRREPFNAQSRERHLVIEAWREEHAADPEENNRMIVNTTSADFQTGEGLAGGDVNVLSPINKMDHETLTPNDDFTQARRHRNAAEAMEDYKAKIAAKPKIASSGTDEMTKDAKRALRRAYREEERTWVIPPNPHAPAANIYLRPAESRDMSQVMKIYNHDVRETSFVPHLDVVDDLYWYVYFLSESAPNPDHLLGCKTCFGSKEFLIPIETASLFGILL